MKITSKSILIRQALFAILMSILLLSMNLYNRAMADDDERHTINVGNIGLIVTNYGTVGLAFAERGRHSCEYPIGSHKEHMFLGGLSCVIIRCRFVLWPHWPGFGWQPCFDSFDRTWNLEVLCIGQCGFYSPLTLKVKPLYPGVCSSCSYCHQCIVVSDLFPHLALFSLQYFGSLHCKFHSLFVLQVLWVWLKTDNPWWSCMFGDSMCTPTDSAL